AQEDPLQYRAELLAHDERATKLVTKLRELSDWRGNKSAATRSPTNPDARFGRGVAIHASFRSLVGQVVDISVTEGRVKVEKVSCVIDCGTVINPDSVRAQMESGIIFALSAAAFGEINFENGRVKQSNFHNYKMVRMAQCPAIDVEIMDDEGLPGGVGEPATPPFFAALTNAIYAATGKRLRSLPISKSGFSLV
ncbi:MAG: molybdopterin cofactor-binding domain-containing protein, partial [Gammaproteobacteria bacterium]